MQQRVDAPVLGEAVGGGWFQGFTETRVYDFLMRAIFACWFTVLATVQALGVAAVVRAEGAVWDLALAADVTARATGILFLSLIICLAVIRSRPVGKARGLQPRFSALAGSFLLLAVVLFPRQELSVAMNFLSAGLILVGHALAIYALLRLGRSFSIMAEARRLVTDGPYARVRHPLYLAEEIAAIGLFLQFLSVWTAMLFVVQFAFQLRRMANEERVLRDTFPEYAAYAERTPRLIPGVY